MNESKNNPYYYAERDAFWGKQAEELISLFDNILPDQKESDMDDLKYGSLIPKTDNNPKTAAALLKPRVSDVPTVAFYALGAAMSDGATKYGRYNWRDTSVTASVFYDAMNRHLSAWYNGEDFAQDSKINHLAHIMASCAILLDSDEHGVFNDDRDKRLPFPPTTKTYKG
jgi:hypothetical protein